MDDNECVIGIKIGSHCCVGIYRNDKIDIIQNSNDEKLIPLIVSFTKNEILIGEDAKWEICNLKNTIYGINNLIGRKYDDFEVQRFIKTIPYKVIKDSNLNKPKIIVEYKGETKSFFPEEIYGIFFKKLKEDIENYLEKNIKDVVIAVSYNLNDFQKEAIKDSFLIAELNVLNIINEPIATCIAYELDKVNNNNSNILIFSMGSNELNISILNCKNCSFDIKTNVYDENLGGDNFDNELIKYCIKEFLKERKINLNNDEQACRKLKIICEKVKIKLSSLQNSNIEIDNLINGIDFSKNITRKNFENMNKHLFEKCIFLIEKALNNLNLNKNQIDKIILTGGTTNIPQIQKIIKDYFNGKEVIKMINPEEVYTYGAAIKGYLLKQNFDNKIHNKTKLSLGIDKGDGTMHVIIPKNTIIPCKNNINLNKSKNIILDIYEGENKLIKENKLLCKCSLNQIFINSNNYINIKIIFEINTENYLIIKIEENDYNKSFILKIFKYNNDKNDWEKFKDNDINNLNTILKEKEESKNYIQKLDLKKTNEKINTFTGTNITKHDLEIVQLNNPEKNKKRIKEIKNITSDLNNKQLSNKEYMEKVLELGLNIKENVIYETFHNSENFISKEEINKSKEGEILFIEGAFLNYLKNNKIISAIEKKTKDENLAHTMLQLITSGEAFNKIINISTTFGEEKDALILSNEIEKEKFIKMKKKEYSIALNIPENNIIISNLRQGSINYFLRIKEREITKEEYEIIIKDLSSSDIKLDYLLSGCIISPSMFDLRGNRNEGWGEGEKRGPPNYLIDYDPPLGWSGYGLKVLNEYDKGDNTWLGYSNIEGEWYIAYHGTNALNSNSIIQKGFGATLNGQLYQRNENINPLSKNSIKELNGKIGFGVYCTPKIKEAEKYSEYDIFEYLGKKYKFVFMCRINPYKVRICKDKPEYWVVSGDNLNQGVSKIKKYDDEIRPYRILLKET